MRFFIEHRTRYVFSRPVFLEPHVIRLIPQQDPRQRLISFECSIDPAPAGQWRGLDQEGSPFIQAWFDGMHEEFSVATRITAETMRTNPFGYLPVREAQTVPPVLDPDAAAALAPCLRRVSGDRDGEDVAAQLSSKLLRECGGSGGAFLTALNVWIFENIEKIVRREAGILPPARTLAAGRGACRDAAVLFMDCCRAVGLPARFVSGYQAGDRENPGDAHDLHAWAEACLPGAGWLGFDPTHGLAVADSHLSLAASHAPEATAPLQGTFRGTGASSVLTHDVRLRAEG